MTTSEMDETLNQSTVNGSEVSYEELVKFVTPISKPLASRKLTKKIYKCAKKAQKQKKGVLSGIKNVQKMLKKGEKGLVILAGDARPIEIICHFPVLCEDKNIPYCFVPSQKEFGAAMSRTSTIAAFVTKQKENEEVYNQVVSGIKKLPPVL